MRDRERLQHVFYLIDFFLLLRDKLETENNLRTVCFNIVYVFECQEETTMSVLFFVHVFFNSQTSYQNFL